jgi:hypothetical protein
MIFLPSARMKRNNPWRTNVVRVVSPSHSHDPAESWIKIQIFWKIVPDRDFWPDSDGQNEEFQRKNPQAHGDAMGRTAQNAP